MSSIPLLPQRPYWTRNNVLALQFFTVFFALLSLPIDYKFFVYLFSGEWLGFHITDLIKIVSYLPSFFNELENEHYLGIDGFVSWGIIALLSVIGLFIWNVINRKPGFSWLTNYDGIYYWLRVLLRYRLAFILITYGTLKIFPLQFPHPSLSNLHTNYGDFLNWKIWYHTLGITPNYTAFIGSIEILSGLLLFYRRSVVFGAGLAIGVIINVVFSSFSYQMGNQVLPVYVLIAALFLFVHDLPRLYSLLYLEVKTEAEVLVARVSARWTLIFKALLTVLVFVVFLSALFNYKSDPYLTPKSVGLKGAYGYYNVKEFILNNDTIPYSRTDSNRWQNVVFEQWATISIKTAKPVKVDSSLYLTKKLPDIERVYESAGVDGRRYFAYSLDSATQTLHLNNKNAYHVQERYELVVSRPDDRTIILEGVNETRDRIKAVLERVDRKFLLLETRRHPIQL